MSWFKGQSAPIFASAPISAISTVVLALLLGTPSGVVGQATDRDSAPVEIESTVSNSRVQIAEPFELVIQATARDGVAIRFPDSLPMLGVFDIIDIQDRFDIPTADGRQWIRRYRLESVVSGVQVIPAIEIGFVDRAADPPNAGVVLSGTQEVVVVSALEGTEDPTQFRDIKNVVFLPEPSAGRSDWIFWAGGGVLGLFAVLALMVVRSRKSRKSPRQRALGALAELTESDLFRSGDVEPIYVSLTDIVRVFVSDELGISAPTLTTNEFLHQLQMDSDLSELMRAMLQEFLTSADMVKFAQLAPDGSVLDQAFANAKTFILECESDSVSTKPLPTERNGDSPHRIQEAR